MQNNLKGIFGSRKELDQRSLDSLVKALERSNKSGFDYIEFKQALGRLLEMGIDQATAFKSAFATASTVGLTKDKLLQTADFYKKVLFNEKQEFDSALQKQYKAKIQQLEQQIAKAQSTIDHADEDVREAKEKIAATKDGFETTLRTILEDIDQDIEQIKNLL
mgnify:CR=1 FL=1